MRGNTDINPLRKAYEALNTAQRDAADTIEGPLLVIAGPGTGKTQLLSVRVARILQQTDTPAQNILCLTFTESGAENMRRRLSSFIGQAAYDVGISTYHAFGGDLIRRYPEYFAETRLQNPVDELGRRQIITAIVDAMSYTNPLKQTRHHLEDLLSTLSEVKRALLKGDDLRAIAEENLRFIQAVNRELKTIFADFTRVPALTKALPYFEQTHAALLAHAPAATVNERFGSLAAIAAASLTTALESAQESNKTTPLTAWKNDWLVKNENNEFALADGLESQRIRALGNVIEQYQAALAERGLYDFDDMIIRSVETLERHPDLRFTLQEKYLYILLDEFQDTNAAQARLVQLLADNPIHEGRPNIMAVGDDDQAIYAFQGAQYSNMLDFYNTYRNVRVINLTENYRSHADILLAAHHVADQIDGRLHHYFEGMSKTLMAANTQLPERAVITRQAFLSDVAQADAIAREVRSLIDRGTSPSEIAIIAPRHRQLEPLAPYLNALAIPVRYEKREDILETPVVKQLLTMSRLVHALHVQNEVLADSLWPEVLSYDFWRLPVSSIWEMSWRIADARSRSEPTSWTRALLADGKTFRIPALLYTTLAGKVSQETCETMLDYLIGTSAVNTREVDLPHVYSPLREFYVGTAAQQEPELFYETISHLAVLRTRLREHQQVQDTPLSLEDLLSLVDLYAAAEERMLNTSPYAQAADAVQLMTVFKAKGLEFQHVFLPSLQDDVWGSTSRSQGNRLTLPANLAPIRHAGATNDERLRIFFVAITRAKIGLHLSNVAQTYSGKQTRPLKYLDERQEDGETRDLILPPTAQIVHGHDTAPPAIQLLELDWRRRHTAAYTPTLQALLEERVSRYRLSPTHLSTFLNLEYAGPQRFFFSTILRFPEAPSPDSEFGNAIHETLEWIQHTVTARQSLPTITEATEYFTARMQQKKLSAARTALEIERGKTALSSYLTVRGGMYKPTDRAEVNFRNEGVHMEDIQLGGKIDRLEINTKERTITVVDYKTGKSYNRWENIPKLQRYRQQLYAYKLLVEESHAFAGYRVDSGRLEFIEPDGQGNLHNLTLAFQDEELARTRGLLVALWQHVKTLNFPDTQAYDATAAGIRRFEDDLLSGTI